MINPWADRMAEMIVIHNPKTSPSRAFKIAEDFYKILERRQKNQRAEREKGRKLLDEIIQRFNAIPNPDTIQKTIHNKRVVEISKKYDLEY